MDYEIIYSRSEDIREGIANLENDVERFIEEGWELQGGVCCSTQSRDDDSGSQQVALCQAMIKQ